MAAGGRLGRVGDAAKAPSCAAREARRPLALVGLAFGGSGALPGLCQRDGGRGHHDAVVGEHIAQRGVPYL